MVILIQSAVFVLRGYTGVSYKSCADKQTKWERELKREKQKFCNFVSRFSTQPVVRPEI